MATHRWRDVKKKHFTTKENATRTTRAKREVEEMNLRALRELAGATQEEMASKANMQQSSLSKLEHRRDLRLSTLRRYVEALGGELHIEAVIGRRRVKLGGI